MKCTYSNIKSLKVYQDKNCLCYIELQSIPKDEYWVPYITKINQNNCFNHRNFIKSHLASADFEDRTHYKRQYYA